MGFQCQRLKVKVIARLNALFWQRTWQSVRCASDVGVDTPIQWRCQLWGTWARAPSTSNNFIFSSPWSKSDSQLSKYCAVCEISRRRCQKLTALSTSTALVTKLLITKQSAAPGPEVRRECSMTKSLALTLLLLATNPGDATAPIGSLASTPGSLVERGGRGRRGEMKPAK